MRRDGGRVRVPGGRALLLWLLAAAAALGAAACSRESLPGGLAGHLVFVSDRSGRDALYIRRLPDGHDRPLLFGDEDVGEPALSPDGREVAFTMGGRVGIVPLSIGIPRFLTDEDWEDAAPAWRPDGGALVVSSRRRDAENADLHLLVLGPGPLRRQPLTRTPNLGEASPAFSPDGAAVAFVREDHVFRLDLADGRVRRLTAGLRSVSSPRFLPTGRLVCLWSQGKQFGLEAMDADGSNRATLAQGSTFYRTLVASPDGRWLAATVSFEPDALALRQQQQVRLFDASGNPRGTLVGYWRKSGHSPDWGR